MFVPCVMGVQQHEVTTRVDAVHRAKDQVESMLKNAATAQESYATGHGGGYTTDVQDLVGQGLALDPEVTITIVSASELSYCIEGILTDGGSIYSYSSDTGTVE